jgi:hypothetical protein
MNQNLTDLTALKRRVDSLKSESDQAKGALDVAMKRLKDEFKCATIEEAEALLVIQEAEAKEAEQRFNTALTEFNKKWEGKL